MLAELNELLECGDKIGLADKYAIKDTIRDITKMLPREKKKGIRQPKIMNKHHFMIKDKKKHGCYHWNPTATKRFFKKVSRKIVRKSYLLNHRGTNSYRRCFDYACAIW